MRRLSIAAGNTLAAFLSWLADRCAAGSRRLARCPDCGNNRWYGEVCPFLDVPADQA